MEGIDVNSLVSEEGVQTRGLDGETPRLISRQQPRDETLDVLAEGRVFQ